MSNEFTVKSSISCIKDGFELAIGKTSHRIDQTDVGVYSRNGIATAGITLSSSQFGFPTGGMVHVANLSPNDTYKSIYLAITSDLNKFAVVDPGNEYVFHSYPGPGVFYRLGPNGSGTDPFYEFNIFKV